MGAPAGPRPAAAWLDDAPGSGIAPRPAGPATAFEATGAAAAGEACTVFAGATLEAPGIGIGARPAGAATPAGAAACGVGIGARPFGAATVGRDGTGVDAGAGAVCVGGPALGAAAAGVVRGAGRAACAAALAGAAVDGVVAGFLPVAGGCVFAFGVVVSCAALTTMGPKPPKTNPARLSRIVRADMQWRPS